MIPVHDTPLMWKNFHSSATLVVGLAYVNLGKCAGRPDHQSGLEHGYRHLASGFKQAFEHEHLEGARGGQGPWSPERFT